MRNSPKLDNIKKLEITSKTITITLLDDTTSTIDIPSWISTSKSESGELIIQRHNSIIISRES
jgi:hypothetical protein